MKLLSLLLICSFVFAQTRYTQKDVEVCKSKFDFAVDAKLSDKKIGDIVTEIGKSFIGTDYKAHTLESPDKERVSINLSGLDCYTFLESVLALSRLVKKGNTDFDSYLREIQNLRYKKGRMKEYPSRLHYFSDWIYDVSKRRITKDITKDIGGVTYKNNVNFMSNNPKHYEKLRANPEFIEEMKMIEEVISRREYYYVPQNRISKVDARIQSGDIIGITTSVKGLDISHTGIAIRLDDGKIHLMHAPSEGKKVQISEKTLAEYINGNRIQTGIIVARPL